MLSWFSSLLPDRGLKEDCSMVFSSMNPFSITAPFSLDSLPQWAPKSGSMNGRGEGGAIFNKSPQRFALQVMVELPWTFGEVGGGKHRMSIPEALDQEPERGSSSVYHLWAGDIRLSHADSL